MATIEAYSKPHYLYWYRSLAPGPSIASQRRLNQELDALREGYVYCAGYGAMNDPMEGLYRSSRRVRGQDDYDEVVEVIAAEKLGLGIASLAETWDHALMWAHYADGFRGICVAYNLQRLKDGLPGECALSRVRYAESPHGLNLAGITDERNRARAVLSTKAVLWSYEREWRLFSPQKGKARYRTGAVSHVLLGSRIRKSHRALIVEALKEEGIPVKSISVDGYNVVLGRRASA